MLVIAQINQKGGVGKTTLGFHLAHRARELGRRTLVVDLESQGNLSTALWSRSDLLNQTGGADRLFTATEASEVVITPIADNLDLLHGHRRLDSIEGDFNPREAASAQRSLLRSLPYDVVILD